MAPSPSSGPGSAPWWFRAYLYLTAAVCGGAIMIIEIMGTKMLAPYVGTSHFVWTAQIAVTLTALALGYYAGGRLAAAAGRPLRWLYVGLGTAGTYLLGSVIGCRPVAYAFLNLQLPVAALLTSATVFFVPLCLLAMTAPVLVHTMTPALERVGPTVGRLTAFGTLGSLLGTLLAGYALPLVPNSQTMSVLALVLVVLAAVYLAGQIRRAGPRVALVIGLAGAGLLARAAIGSDRWRGVAGMELFRRNSFYGDLQVIQLDGPRRLLLNDYLLMTGMDPATEQGLFAYTYIMEALARVNSPRLDRVLCIGMGAGCLPMAFVRTGSAVDVVEINPAVVPVARKWFGFQPDRVGLTIADGRAFLNRAGGAYDAILLDAFAGEATPSHLFSREAFAAMKARLEPGGTLVINSIGELKGAGDFLAASLFRTLSAVFSDVQIFSSGAGLGNVIFVASDHPPPGNAAPVTMDIHPGCLAEVRAAHDAGPRSVDASHGIVLTDDFNPADYYDAPNREKFRRELAAGAEQHGL